ncbi:MULTISPECIES: helix-turn-helix domain-containing protein [Lactococcus]|uniref:helix-turn-helix domain-containing protein n=1 Tax=Lactococcus garvieae TaxID=1363 RepID=UPI002097CC1B|nr:helix-turn-helix transcriptional regulator [Lactococcus garvieae]MCO7129793.1 helix-turn-helix domain-containing protein [Lactococcus garvieae]
MFYERLKSLAKEKKKSLNQIEEDLGFSKNTLYNTKKYTPQGEKLSKLAEYFDVSIDYLLGNTTAKDYDSKRLDESIENSKSFDGSPLDDEDKEIIHNLIKDYLESKGK